MVESWLDKVDSWSKLSALFVLSGADHGIGHDEVQTTKITGAGELMSLIEQTFLLDPNDMSS